jgi:hypothetical protein
MAIDHPIDHHASVMEQAEELFHELSSKPKKDNHDLRTY